VRRPRLLAVAQRVDADHRAVKLLQRLRVRYGPGPLRLRMPGREVALVLSPDHVQRILACSPEPFAVANREKRAALSQFQPQGALVSDGRARAQRRRVNEAVLDTYQSVHRLAAPITTKLREEAGHLLTAAGGTGELVWDDFGLAWWRAVRRVVLGDGARDDHELTDMLARLRADANWGYLHPKRRRLRARFLRRLRAHLDDAEAGSLGALVAAAPGGDTSDPAGQVSQWLFASDAAGMDDLPGSCPCGHPSRGAGAAVPQVVRPGIGSPVANDARDPARYHHRDELGNSVLPARTALWPSPRSSTATTARCRTPSASPLRSGWTAGQRATTRSCRSAPDPSSAPDATSCSHGQHVPGQPARTPRPQARGTQAAESRAAAAGDLESLRAPLRRRRARQAVAGAGRQVERVRVGAPDPSRARGVRPPGRQPARQPFSRGRTVSRAN
jgi:hypothetical protein